MKIALASDRAGYAAKELLKPLCDELGVEFEDLGSVSKESVDYPNDARKVPGGRAAVAWTEETASTQTLRVY